jgi:hypothetical protein
MDKKEYSKKYYKKNKRKFSEYGKDYRLKNKEKIKEYREKNKEKSKDYREKNKEKLKITRKKSKEKYKEKNKKYQKEYSEKNRKKRNIYLQNKRKTDVCFKLKVALRSRLYTALTYNYKTGSAVRDLGCTIKQLKSYLESQFVDGMTWMTHGNGKNKWNIDHITPLKNVDLTDREQLLKVCHYTNLRPLWHIENIKRNRKY